MAENFTYTPGVGGTGAADDIANVKYPFVKLTDGTADSTTAVYVDIGAKANALRVVPANDITDATYIGDIKFGEAEPNSLAIKTAVELIDNAVDGNYLNVNVNAAGTDLSMNAGVLTAQTQRVTLATDGEVNNFLGTIDADTSAMATSLGNLDNSVDGNFLNVNLNFAGTDAQIGEGAISASTLRVTIATDDDGVAHLATIAGDTTAIETAIQIMDDWDATHASAAPADGAQIMGAAYSTALPTDVGADADAARICTDRFGRVLRGIMPQWFNAVYDSANAIAEGCTVKAATAARKIYIMSYTISSDVETWIKLQDEDSNALMGKLWLKAGGGESKTFPPEAPLVLNTANKALEVIAEAAGNVSVTVTGYLAV